MHELLSQSKRSVFIQEHDPATNQAIVWKVGSPTMNSANELQNEFASCQLAAIDGIRKPIRRGIYQNKEAFAYAYFDGIPLSQYLEKNTLSIQEALSIAIRIAQVLKQLHQKKLFHLRLNTNHILYQPHTKEIHVIDFSLASQLPASQTIDFQDWGDELAFVAPEQMGRWGQVADHRTDLYSFGVILYQLLTGKLPFQDTDISRLIHYHLVRYPALPHHLNDQIPASLSNAVLKLLQKNAGERYQTAHGILQDLLECQEALAKGSEPSLDVLGKYDGMESLQLSGKLYSNQEITRHIDVELKNRQGTFFILSGEPGTGKSGIIQSLRKQLYSQNELLITIPGAQPAAEAKSTPFLIALKELAFWLLTLPEDRLGEWRSRLKLAIGQHEPLLSDSIPEFAWIFEPEGGERLLANPAINPPPLFTLFQTFVAGLITIRLQVVLVLEDAHLADESIWECLHSLVGSTMDKGLNLIITTHPPATNPNLTRQLNSLQTLVTNTTSLELSNLTPGEVTEWLRDSVEIEEPEILGSVVHKKTAGNPYFLHQFMQDCHQHGLVWFDSGRMLWAWDQHRLMQHFPTENIVDQLVREMDQPSSPQPDEVLCAAACLETDFTADLLSQLFPGTADPEAILVRAVDEQLLLTSGTSYRFSHEKLRARLYGLTPEKTRSEYHFKIARLLAQNNNIENDVAALYQTATHYALGSSSAPDEERFSIVELNLRAGLAAREASDFRQAYRFFVNGIDLVREKDWDTQYETVLLLYNQATEAGLINGLQKEADRWLQQALQRARTIDDRIRSHEIKLNQLSESHQFGEAVAHLLTVLEEIGYGMPRYPSKLYMLRELLAVTWLIRNKSVDSIPKMPAMTQERALAFLKVVVNSATSIHGFAPELAPIMYMRCIKLSLQYGLSEYAPFAYMGYATIQLFFGRARRGYEYGQMALRLTDQLSAEVVRAKVMVVFYGFISFWRESLRDSIEPLRAAYQIARKNGDLQYASFALNFCSVARWHAGDNLADLLTSIEEDIRLIREMKQPLVLTISEVLHHFVLRLVQDTDSPLGLREDDIDESALLARLDEIGDSATKFDLYVHKVILACLLNHYAEAQAASDLAGKYEEENTSHQNIYPSFLLFSTIACIVNARNNDTGQASRLNKKIRRNIRMMKTFAREVPQNYANKLALLRALDSENRQTPAKTVAHYEEAIKLARQNNFLHEEALAREYFARYLYRTEQRPEYSDWLMKRAFRDYEKWGSKAKCRQLKKEFPDLIGDRAGADHKISFELFQDHFDLTTIIQANQMLSLENTLNGLLTRMVEIVIQNTSVTKTLILLKNQDQKFIPRASGASHGSAILEGNEKDVVYPERIVQWVVHTKSVFTNSKSTPDQSGVLGSLGQDTIPLSVCCLPIISQKSLLGVLYLENSMAAGVFDEKRIDFFVTISSQLAISLDNVILYEEMENKVKQRTIALEQSLKDLRAAQESLIQKEKLASLGELMAGIAHEIQNPLNFVNNFSEVSSELLDDLETELTKDISDEATYIITDLKDNLTKINAHGHRAGSIINGMLEHARSKTGEKTSYPLNDLVEEYLRLAYQNMHIRISDFSCELHLSLDSSIDTIRISVSDVGRVLLNLYNNAFYAMNVQRLYAGDGYQPRLLVSTKRKNDLVEIRVKDNGTGIPDEIQTKIFQPFFTTKPTGEGTGLGLSLSYDIIVKGHGGTFRVESEPNQGTEFIVEIPAMD